MICSRMSAIEVNHANHSSNGDSYSSEVQAEDLKSMAPKAAKSRTKGKLSLSPLKLENSNGRGLKDGANVER